MQKIILPLADGFEEIEAVSIIDVCRRGGLHVDVVSVSGSWVEGAHGIKMATDMTLDQCDIGSYDMLVFAGGMDNVNTLSKNQNILDIVQVFDEAKKPIGAICASPLILDKAMVLRGEYVCYPSVESSIASGTYTSMSTTLLDSNIITSKGPATAMEFGLEIVKMLGGQERYEELKNKLLV